MTTLYAQFEVEQLKRYLRKNPHESERLAIAHFQDYLKVTLEYQKLYLQANNHVSQDVTNKIYSTLRNQYYKIEQKYNNVLVENVNLKKEIQQLRQENHNLVELINLLASKSAPIPDFWEEVLEWPAQLLGSFKVSSPIKAMDWHLYLTTPIAHPLALYESVKLIKCVGSSRLDRIGIPFGKNRRYP